MKKIIKNILKEELERTKELMGLLVEQTNQVDFHIWITCTNGVIVAPSTQAGPQGQQNWGPTDPNVWAQEALQFYQLMQTPQVGDTVQFDTTSDVTPLGQDAYGKCLEYLGISTCSVPITPQTPTFSNWGPLNNCTQFFGGASYVNPSYIGTCSDCPTCTSAQAPCSAIVDEYNCGPNGQCVVSNPGTFNAGPTSQDNENDCLANCGVTGPLVCDTGAPDWTPQQWGSSYANFVVDCDAKEQDAINGLASGCNWICNRVNSLTAAVANATPGTVGYDRKQCKLDYVQTAANNVPCINSNTGNCTSGSQSGTLSQTWIDLMTNRYNGTGGPSGCWGISGNNTNSVCGRKAYFCGLPSQSPMQQAKCAWLTTFTANNNCNC